MKKLQLVIDFLPLLLIFGTWLTMVVLFLAEFKMPLPKGGVL